MKKPITSLAATVLAAVIILPGAASSMQAYTNNPVNSVLTSQTIQGLLNHTGSGPALTPYGGTIGKP